MGHHTVCLYENAVLPHQTEEPSSDARDTETQHHIIIIIIMMHREFFEHDGNSEKSIIHSFSIIFIKTSSWTYYHTIPYHTIPYTPGSHHITYSYIDFYSSEILLCSYLKSFEQIKDWDQDPFHNATHTREQNPQQHHHHPQHHKPSTQNLIQKHPPSNQHFVTPSPPNGTVLCSVAVKAESTNSTPGDRSRQGRGWICYLTMDRFVN